LRRQVPEVTGPYNSRCGVSTFPGSEESRGNDPEADERKGRLAGLEIHSEEGRTGVRTTTLRWFSRGREGGGGAEEQTTMDGKRIVILLPVFASSGGSAWSE
jgi:hypothetical protein